MIQDLAGNRYTYDAEGNVVSSTAGTLQSTYDALNQRVKYQGTSGTTYYAFNAAGQRAAAYDAAGNLQREHIYWGGTPVAWVAGNTLKYQFQNWIGTEVFNVTPWTGASEYAANPFGDSFHVKSGSDEDAYHYAGLDGDDDGTMHAQFRSYTPTLARWTSPDPYDGSYQQGDPQSYNRYSYVMNNPLSYLDPSGLYYDCHTYTYRTSAVKSGDLHANDTGTFEECFWFPDYGSGGGGGYLNPAPGVGLPDLGTINFPAPNNCTNGVGTGGVGVGAGYNADLGVGAAGASSTGGVGGGLFHNKAGGLFGGYSGGLFGSGGGTAYAGSHQIGVPSQASSTTVFGAYAGAGANFFFTNAGGAQQLAGPFTTLSVNVGVGVANLGVQLSFGGGIWQLSVSPPFASVGVGAAGSIIRTNTVATHAGCH